MYKRAKKETFVQPYAPIPVEWRKNQHSF